MAKASRVRYTGTAPFIDDAQGNRIQALGSSSRLSTEDIKELGTLNIVEVVDDVPQVDVSVDANENGTNELLGLLSNKGFGCQVEAVPSGSAVGTLTLKVNPGSYYAKGQRVLFEGTTVTAQSSGNQVVYLQPTVSSDAVANKVGIGASLPAGAIQIASITPSANIVTQANITDSRTWASISATDFELAKADMYVPIKQSGDGLNGAIARTMYMERVYANNIDLSFQVNGVATASYRMETDNKRWFLNSASQMVVDEIKTTTATALTLTNTPYTLANGNKTLKVTKNGTQLVEGTDYTVSGVTLTLTSAPSTGDLVKVRYVTNGSNGKFFAPVPALETPHPDLAGGLKEGQIELYLVANDGVTVDTARATRIQTARISAPLQREPLAELGSMYPYDRPLSLPLNISVSLELKDSDLELMARFAGYSNLASANEIALDDLVKDKGLLVKIYRETDVKRAKLPAGHVDKYAIKTIYIKNLIPQSESWDVRVDSDATQSFEFMAHNLTITDKYLNANQVS
jgi:hypothetical protein